MRSKLDKTYSVCYTKGMELNLPTLECQRCDHQLYPKHPRFPLRCSKCKTPYWRTRKNEKKKAGLFEKMEKHS